MSRSIEKWARAGGWAVVALGITAAFVSRGREASATEDDARPRGPSAVTVLPVESTAVRRRHVFHGVVRSADRARVAFVDGGRVVERAVEVGDRVTAGQVLARLDPRPYRNAVRASTASRQELALRSEQLARDRERAERLRRDGVTTDARLEQAVSGFERVEAMREAARAQAAESRRRQRESALRAPFDGVVTDVLVERGELVGAGQPVVRLAGEGAREVLLEVPVEVASHVSPGDPVALRAVGVEADDPLSGRAFSGAVRSVAGEAASLRGLYPVVVEVQGPARAGLGVEAELLGPPRDAIRVPLAAVLDPSGRRPFVWTVEDGRASRRWLRLGGLTEGSVEVLDGLTAGDRVVVRGHQHLLEGDAVDAGGAS